MCVLPMALGLCACLPTGLPRGDEDALRPTDVFVGGTSGYHSYRIPALILAPSGSLLAFCEGRKTSRSDDGDIDLLLRRSTDDGATWEPTQVVYDDGGDAKITIGNPCPVVDRSTGRIWLPFCRDNDRVFVTSSGDDGRSWDPPREITADVKRPGWTWFATGPGVGIQLEQGPHAGRLLIPCDHRRPLEGKAVTHSHVIYSDDHGATWQLGGSVGPYANECQVVELDGGRLLLNMRNHWSRDGGVKEKGKRRLVATSDDGGATWSEPRLDETLIEPICQASLIRVGRMGDDVPDRLLFSNPASTTTRDRLTVRASGDGGRTWSASRLLDEGPSAYSCLAVLPDGTVGCLYECGESSAYERIAFVRFPMDSLRDERRTE